MQCRQPDVTWITRPVNRTLAVSRCSHLSGGVILATRPAVPSRFLVALTTG